MMDRIVLFGGSNIDVVGKAGKQLVGRDSNLGKITLAYGGVGRNVCETLVRLGNQITFITVVGDDVYGVAMKKQLEDLGVKVLTPQVSGMSSTYMAICAANGDMELALCDNRIMDNLKMSFIKTDDEEIRARDYLVMEMNLTPRIIADLFHFYPDKKWCVEAVSGEKVEKVRKYLSRVYLFKSNLLEARKATGLYDKGIEQVAQALLDDGVQKVVISNGAAPICIADKQGIRYIEPAPVTKVVSTNGVGDALFAGIIDKLNSGVELDEAVKFGTQLSAVAIQSLEAVPEEMNRFKYDHK